MKTRQSINATKTETDEKSIDHLSTFDDAATTTSSAKRDYDQTSTILYDEVSVSTGAGKKALSELLSTSKRIDNEQPFDDYWNLQDDQISYEAESVAADVTKTMPEEVDELSVSVGPGKHALSALLSFSVYDDPSMPQQHKKQNKKQKTTNSKRKRSTNISSNIVSDDSSFLDSVTDAGRHALQSLLGLASESEKPIKQSSIGKKVKKTSNKSSSAPSKKSASYKKKQVSITNQKIVSTKKGEDSSISDSSTGAGKQALNSLLGMAMEETCNSSDDKECHI
eukprot:scaffold61517_cov67-Cyclotella_meneghiniana.AAC.2